MRGGTKWSALAVLAVLALAVMLDAVHAAAGGLLLAMPVFPVTPRTLQNLQDLANPPAGKGVSEAVPWMFYDMETYTDNSTTQLTFFQTAKSDPGRSNMQAAGQLTAPQYFEMFFTGLDIMRAPTATALAAWSDAWQLLMGTGTAAQAAPTWQFTMSDKVYGPFPMSTLHGTGGLHGSQGYGTTTADTINEYQTNSVPDGGWSWNGSVMIPPSVGFSVLLRWPTAVNISADAGLRVNLLGVLHRRVL